MIFRQIAKTTSTSMFRFEFQMRIVQGMCALLLTALAVSATAQKQVRTFYDPGQRRPHEEYMVSIADNETLNGKYKRYFPDGKTEIEGTFIDGKRSGVFYEYHENGTLLRKISYVNGLRHGP